MVTRYHPVIGHLYVPNLRARLPNELGGYYVRTNSAGFRSDVEFAAPGGERPRILFFGDSNIAGDGCNNHERFSDIVGRVLDAEVYNYGLSGSGTDQQLLILENLARPVHADLIVLGAVVHNIERLKVAFRESIDRAAGTYVQVPKPYFTLVNGELRLHHVPVPLTRPPSEGLNRDRFDAGMRGGDRYESSPLVRLYGKLRPVHRLVHPLFPTAKAALRRQMLRWTGFQPHDDYRSADSAGWRLMEAVLARFCETAADVPVLIVPIPTRYFLRGDAVPIYQELFDRLNDGPSNAHVANITEPLLNLSREDRRALFLKADSHFSAAGHERLAELIAGEIVQRKLLPGRSKPPPRRRRMSRSERQEPLRVLGLSCFYHNSAACLVQDGRIVAAAEEERFTRRKNDRRFPLQAANYCLEEAGINQTDLAAVVYYENPWLTFERIMHTQLAIGDQGLDSWLRVMPTWVEDKLHLPQLIRRQLQYRGEVLQEVHHRSHAASAFYPSPFHRAAILTIDGVGEWATASIGVGIGNKIRLLKEMRFPHSLGLLYSAFTQFMGFKVNSGEYKMMGLAPYGQPRYVNAILEHLVDLKDDGSVELNLEYFEFLSAPTMTSGKFAALFGGPPRSPESRLTRREMDLARSIQVITEEAMLRMASFAHKLTGESRLCLAGGVALNCVANGQVLRKGPFEDIWIQPAAGDAGCALGAALDVYHTYFGRPRELARDGRSPQGGSLVGPCFSNDEIRAFVETHGCPYRQLQPSDRASRIAGYLNEGKVVGHFASRTEFGPRALGARSILADARRRDTQANLNLKIKYRESFRPFAPTVLAQKVRDYFELDRESPYMLLVADVGKKRRKPVHATPGDDLLEQVKQVRSDIPAVTHVDYSARIQTITREDHPKYYDVLEAFDAMTGTPVLVNTSFNVRGEPIVNTPYDAYRCFMRTEMDVLVLEDYLLLKEEQPEWPENEDQVEVRQPDRPPLNNDRRSSRLRKLFVREFLPLARRLRECSLIVRSNGRDRRRSMWTDYLADQSATAIFVVPAALDTAKWEPDAMAEAMTRYWERGSVTDQLRSIVAQLLKLTQETRDATPRQLEEDVSDAIYVMY